MKILNVCSVPITFPGGSEKVILELSKEMAKKHDVTVLQTTLYEKGMDIIGETMLGKIKLITCKNDKHAKGYGYSKEFKETLRKIWKKYDIIHIYGHGRFTSDYALKFLRGKKPLVYSPHGFFHDKKHSFFKKLHGLLFRRLLKKSRPHCIALTEIEEAKFKSFGAKNKDITIFPGGIDLKKIKKRSLSKLRKRYCGAGKEKIMLYVGRVHHSKGIHHVIRAIKDIDVKFLVVGKDADYRSELEKIVRDEGLQEKVKFLGAVSNSELEELYYLSDFFVLFSAWEGFGLVIIEAMNNSKPVIVSDRGSLPLIVKENETGFIVKYPNVKALSPKIIEMISDGANRKRMGRNAKKFSRRFGWDNLAKEHLELYGEMLKNEK